MVQCYGGFAMYLVCSEALSCQVKCTGTNENYHYTHDCGLLPPDYHLAITVVVHIGIIFQSPVEAIYRYYRATHSLPWMHATTVEKMTQTSSRMACTSNNLSNGLLQRASFAQNAIIMVGREANPEQQTIRFTHSTE